MTSYYETIAEDLRVEDHEYQNFSDDKKARIARVTHIWDTFVRDENDGNIVQVTLADLKGYVQFRTVGKGNNEKNEGRVGWRTSRSG